MRVVVSSAPSAEVAPAAQSSSAHEIEQTKRLIGTPPTRTPAPRPFEHTPDTRSSEEGNSKRALESEESDSESHLRRPGGRKRPQTGEFPGRLSSRSVTRMLAAPSNDTSPATSAHRLPPGALRLPARRLAFVSERLESWRRGRDSNPRWDC